MLELFAIWLGTSITSIGMELIYELRMMKDISDAGYKYDNEGLRQFKEKNKTNSNLFYYLIPFFNLAYVLDKAIKYNNNSFTLLDQFRVMGVIEEMTPEEIKEYEKNPTGLNAFKMQIKNEVNKKAGIDNIKIQTKNEVDKRVGIDSVRIETKDEGTIEFKFDEKNKKVNIINATGDLAQLSEKEQIAFIIKTILELKNKDKKAEETPIVKEPIENTITEENNESLSRSEKIENLKDLRQEIIEEFKQNDSKQTENGFQKRI